jgi:hypothetical protein
MGLEDRPVVARVCDEKDESFEAEVALFSTSSSFRRLEVIESCLGFDHGTDTRPVDHDVRTPHVPWQRDRHLGSPAKAGRYARSKSANEREVGRVPDRRAFGQEIQAKLMAEDGRDHREAVDGHSADPKTLHSTDRRMGHPCPSSKLPLAEARSDPGDAYLVADSAAFRWPTRAPQSRARSDVPMPSW